MENQNQSENSEFKKDVQAFFEHISLKYNARYVGCFRQGNENIIAIQAKGHEIHHMFANMVQQVPVTKGYMKRVIQMDECLDEIIGSLLSACKKESAENPQDTPPPSPSTPTT